MKNSIAVLALMITFGSSLLYAETFIYDGEGRRDPFVLLVSQSGKILSGTKLRTSFENISLGGIVFDPKDKKSCLVIINGEVYRQGDKVDSFKIKDIQSGKVLLDAGGEEFTLELIEEVIK